MATGSSSAPRSSPPMHPASSAVGLIAAATAAHRGSATTAASPDVGRRFAKIAGVISTRFRLSSVVAEGGIERHAAIDENRRAGDVVAFIRGKPCRNLGHVLGLADAAIGDEGQKPLAGFRRLPGGGVDARADGAGGDGVDTDATGRHLLREALHGELT